MRWNQIEITDHKDAILTGIKAKEFVETNCPDVKFDIVLGKTINVTIPSTGQKSLEPHDIKEVLLNALHGKAKKLRTFPGEVGESDNSPVARKVNNVINITPPKLKIEFIYKPDPRTKTVKYLKDPVASVKVEFAGNSSQPASISQKDADQGVINLAGSVYEGKYKLTPDFKLDCCKFDFDDQPVEITLANGDDLTIILEVEILYQKIQLVAHCLLTIPDKTYVPAPGETLEPNPRHNPQELEEPPKQIAGGGKPEGKWKGTYHGLESDKQDIRARVRLLKATIELAYTKAKDDPTILKVFMIPECYFQGRYGAYLIEDSGLLFRRLLHMVSDVKWRDWMFVFGTVNLTFGGTVQEMMNYSPVVRGGLEADNQASGGGGGSRTDTHLRLIQKLLNSAELLDASELDPNQTGKRTPAVNDTVQFQSTENEEKLGKILSRLFDETAYKTGEVRTDLEFGQSKGLDPEQWKQLQEGLKQEVAKLGLTSVVRSLRLCNIRNTSDPLADWAYSGYKDKTLTHLNTNSMFSIKDEPFQKIFTVLIQQEWNSYWGEQLKPESIRFKPGFSTLNWKKSSNNLRLKAVDFKNDAFDDLGKRQNSILEKVKAILDNLDCLPYQKEKLAELNLDALVSNSADLPSWATGKPVYDDNTVITASLSLSIYPVWKKILELYLVKASDKELLKQSIKTLDYRDYCFVAARKAGPWLSFDDPKVKAMAPCRKLVFGLEICADHANGRLRNLVQQPVGDSLTTVPAAEKSEDREIRERKLKEIIEENPKRADVTIDIQLLPSAGMHPLQASIVARKGGYCFNCDGWNKNLGELPRENIIPSWFDGPQDVKIHPWRPHTVIAKGGGDPPNIDEFVPVRFQLAAEIDPKLGDGLVGKTGLGELHVYEEVDLPKN